MSPAITPFYESVALVFDGRPQAVQSARAVRVGRFIKMFQPKEILEWKTYIKLRARTLLQDRYPGFKPFAAVPLAVRVTYFFDAPQSLKAAQLHAIEHGALVYKATRPDVSDNLNKGLFDALTGVLWQDDGLIARIEARKLYTATGPRTELVCGLAEALAPAQARAQAESAAPFAPTLF